MIIDKDLEKLETFYLDKKTGWYIDGEDYAIIPTDKTRKRWKFCYMSCVDGSIDEVCPIDIDMNMDDFSALFFSITKDELIFK